VDHREVIASLIHRLTYARLMTTAVQGARMQEAIIFISTSLHIRVIF